MGHRDFTDDRQAETRAAATTAGNAGEAFEDTVITSYSIHYTKLYDVYRQVTLLQEEGRLVLGVDLWPRRGSRALCSGCVITSYSIHYTKLYDELNVSRDKFRQTHVGACYTD